MLTLARNKAVHSFRRRSRHVFESLEDFADGAPCDPNLDPADEYERRRTIAQVRSVLAELTGQVSRTSFQVLYLRWIEGWPTAQVASALELTPAQVRFRSHRLKRRCRKLLEQAMDGDVSDLPLRSAQR